MSDRDTLTEFLRQKAHAIGKPCPVKPWMTPTTLDYDKGRCGACGAKL